MYVNKLRFVGDAGDAMRELFWKKVPSNSLKKLSKIRFCIAITFIKQIAVYRGDWNIKMSTQNQTNMTVGEGLAPPENKRKIFRLYWWNPLFTRFYVYNIKSLVAGGASPSPTTFVVTVSLVHCRFVKSNCSINQNLHLYRRGVLWTPAGDHTATELLAKSACGLEVSPTEFVRVFLPCFCIASSNQTHR